MIDKLISHLRKIKHSNQLKGLRQFINTGNTLLNPSFRLLINDSKKDHIYLTTGNDCILNCQIIFESGDGNVNIGKKVFIGGSQLLCRTSITIEDNTFISWGCTISDHDSHSVHFSDRKDDMDKILISVRNGGDGNQGKNWNTVDSKPIRIGSNVWIGMNCTILKGVTIGEGAIVAASSVITKNVEAWTIVGGNPARLLKEVPVELRRV